MNKTLKIFGIGVDIASISRFENILNKKIALSFMKKVLHKKELQIMESKPLQQKALYLSERWSIKQAMVKAASQTKLVFSGVNITPNLKIKLDQQNILMIGNYTQEQMQVKLQSKQGHVIAQVILAKQ